MGSPIAAKRTMKLRVGHGRLAKDRLISWYHPCEASALEALIRAAGNVPADRPFLLVWGDHLCSSTHAENLSCADQLLQRYEDGSVLFGLHTVPESGLATCGVLTKE